MFKCRRIGKTCLIPTHSVLMVPKQTSSSSSSSLVTIGDCTRTPSNFPHFTDCGDKLGVVSVKGSQHFPDVVLLDLLGLIRIFCTPHYNVTLLFKTFCSGGGRFLGANFEAQSLIAVFEASETCTSFR